MAFAFEKLLVYQKNVPFAEVVCSATGRFPRGYYFLDNGPNVFRNCGSPSLGTIMRSNNWAAVAGAVALCELAACHVHVAPDRTPPAPLASLAKVYYWRAKPDMLAAYNAYIRNVAQRIDEDARQHGAFISVTTYQSQDTLSPWTHMRVFLLRDSTQLASLGAALDASGARIEPDSAKRRARSDYAATLRDAAASAVLAIIHPPH